MVFITTHDTIMNEQQLIKTIEDQNQVIIAKDATIELLINKLKDAKCELNELYLDRSWQGVQMIIEPMDDFYTIGENQ